MHYVFIDLTYWIHSNYYLSTPFQNTLDAHCIDGLDMDNSATVEVVTGFQDKLG